ncbi:MAG: TonB-dependent receptor [Proteobacteria bacterium]|nr:TonB-dependent receptor [Pseudomonadota bacterium]
MKKKTLRQLGSLGVLLCASAMACAAQVYKFDIRATNLSAALRQFASQTGLQVAYFTKVGGDRPTRPVSGAHTADEALRIILDSSGLTFERIDDTTIAIRATAPATSAEKPAAMPPSLYGVRVASTGEVPAEPVGTATVVDTSSTDAARAPILDEVVITGSNIRGVQNDTAPLMTFDRSYIERSGYTNLMQLVESLPINFNGGASGSSESAPFGNSYNYGQNLTRGTGFNLHGLGSTATLTLINGHRVAPSAQGQFVDMSTIPLSAVERIEILTDGASAIYGADAVAGVVNIILRKNFQGAETGVEYGTATDGTVDEQRATQTLGTSWNSGNVLWVGEFYHRDPLNTQDRDYIMDAGSEAPIYLLPRRVLGTMLFSLNQKLTDSLELSNTILYSYEAVHSKQMGQRSLLGTQDPGTNQWSVNLGLGYDLFADWRLNVDSTVSQLVTHTDLTYTDVTTNEPQLLIKDYHDRFNTWIVDAKTDGSLFSLPAGDVRLAVGGSYREDGVRSTRVRVIPNSGYQVRAQEWRGVVSAYGELYAPLISEQQGIPGVRRVDLSVAGRFDHYSDFGSTSNPKIGLVWTPVAGLDMRVAYSTSFRAPSVAEESQVARGVTIYTSTFANGTIPALVLQGSAPLVAEKSKNLALGFTFKPVPVPGAELSLNYFKIDYTNRISTPPYDDNALSEPTKYGELITGLPSDAGAQAYLNQQIALGDEYFDDIGNGVAGIRYAVDLRQRNAARTQISGLDLATSYLWQRAVDTFSVSLNVTHINKILTSLTSDSLTFDQVNRYNEPLSWRGRALGTWVHGGLSSSLSINYSNRYLNDSLLVPVPIAAWTTFDANVSYDFDKRVSSGWLAGVKTAVGVTNLFNRRPPYAIGPPSSDPQIGFDAYNADAMGRYVSFRLSKHW